MDSTKDKRQKSPVKSLEVHEIVLNRRDNITDIEY